jgi:hypothetical protein
MHDTIGRAGQLDYLSSDLGQQYLLATEDVFQGLRRCVTSISAMVLLLHVGRRTNDLPLEQGLNETTRQVQELLEKARSLDRRFSTVPIHRSLVSSCVLVKVASGELRTALRHNPVLRAETIPAVLATVQRAYNGLRAFSAQTPWDPTTINSSCACASN